MLEHIELKNFQCHEKLALDFVPGVNVIAGTSDVGKSAVLKGLLWLMTNKPQGLGFRRAQAKKGDVVSCKIRIDGHDICRSRSESVNEYTLDGEKFVAMRTDVPKEIAHILNVSPVNIQTQFQAHYLLSSTASEVAKALNESCDLDVIDTTLGRVAAIEREAKETAKIHAKSESDLEAELASLAWVHGAKVLRNEITLKTCYRDAAKREMEAIEKAALSLAHAEEKLGLQEAKTQAFAGMDDLVSLAAKWQEQSVKRHNLACIADRLAGIQEELDDFAKMPEIDASSLKKNADALKRQQQEQDALGRIEAQLKAVLAKMRNAQGKLNQAREELAKCWQGLEVCPLCGAKI